jgi:FkbM family methyltransferase
MSIRHGFTHYYRHFGIRGVLAISAHRALGRPKEITVYVPGTRNPIHLRLRTTDQFLFAEILLHGAYAFDLPFYPRTIVDAGANIGMASLYFANTYPEARIIAIEPESSNFEVLVRNVRSYPAIIPVHAALWNREGEISVSQPDPSTGATGNWAFAVHDGSGTKVRAMTMQTLMNEMHLRSIDLLKVDIEGAEKEVFEGCNWMDRVRCLMIELHDRLKPGCSEAVESVTREFNRFHRHETTVYLRQPELPTSER